MDKKKVIHKVDEIYSTLDNANCCEENKAQKGKGCHLKQGDQASYT